MSKLERLEKEMFKKSLEISIKKASLKKDVEELEVLKKEILEERLCTGVGVFKTGKR